MGDGFNQLSGEDMTAIGFNAHGGDGCISVTSNVAHACAPKDAGSNAARDYATALKIQDRLIPLHNALFIETNPAGRNLH